MHWGGIGSHVESKMAAVSGWSKWRSLGTQVGQFHRWSVSTMDGDNSTVTRLFGESIYTGVEWSGLSRLLGLSMAASSGSDNGGWCRVPHVGWMSL